MEILPVPALVREMIEKRGEKSPVILSDENIGEFFEGRCFLALLEALKSKNIGLAKAVEALKKKPHIPGITRAVSEVREIALIMNFVFEVIGRSRGHIPDEDFAEYSKIVHDSEEVRKFESLLKSLGL